MSVLVCGAGFGRSECAAVSPHFPYSRRLVLVDQVEIWSKIRSSNRELVIFKDHARQKCLLIVNRAGFLNVLRRAQSSPTSILGTLFSNLSRRLYFSVPRSRRFRLSELFVSFWCWYWSVEACSGRYVRAAVSFLQIAS